MTFPKGKIQTKHSIPHKRRVFTPPKSSYFNPVAHYFFPPNNPANSLSPSPSWSEPCSSSTQNVITAAAREIPIRIPSSSSSPIAAALWRELRRIDRLFNLYSDYKHVMDPEGIEDLCRSLEVEHTDVKILMLAWKMKAKKQGFFHRDEWQRGLRRLKVDNMEKLKSALFNLEIQARAPSNFKDFFLYSFGYCLTEERQRNLEVDTVCELLDLVMGPLFRPQVQLLIQFLKAQTEYKALNMDHWISIFHFCNQISFPDLHNYDPNEGWPAILDTFVEWLKLKQDKPS